MKHRKHNTYELDEMVMEKKQGGCLFCLEKDPACLELHHRDRSKKLFGISQGDGKSIEEVEAELEKTDCLCANCHRKLHRQKCGTCGRSFRKGEVVNQYYILSGETFTIDAFFHRADECDIYRRPDWAKYGLDGDRRRYCFQANN